MTRWDVDAAIDALARRQHGAFNRPQTRRCGATAAMERARLRSGRWVRLDENVFALPSHPGTWRRQAMAATLAVPRAVLSHAAAGVLHDVFGLRPGPLDIVVPRTSAHTTALATVHRSILHRATLIDSIPVATISEIIFQLAGRLPAERLDRLVESAAVGRPGLLGEIADRYVELAYSRLPGIAAVRSVLSDRGSAFVASESELEVQLDALLDELPLPPIVRQARLPWFPAASQRVDRLIPAWSLIIEADGRAWHSRVEDFERDRWRDNQATAHGYGVLRFTWQQLLNQGPDCRELVVAAGAIPRVA